ncbi:MAG: pullulanase-associated domain-containing protein, partial [bacterium]
MLILAIFSASFSALSSFAESAAKIAVEVGFPDGAQGKVFSWCLKKGPLTVAQGHGDVPGNLQTEVNVAESGTKIADSSYEVLITIQRDALISCHPSFGDLYLAGKLDVSNGAGHAKFGDRQDWKEKKLSAPENLLTVHYHRYGGDYPSVGLWTWDGRRVKTPPETEQEKFPVGFDDYGPVFQIDLDDYGPDNAKDRIGLLPRLEGDWNRKDGADKYYDQATMSREIWLVGGEERVYVEKPDVNPHVIAG